MTTTTIRLTALTLGLAALLFGALVAAAQSEPDRQHFAESNAASASCEDSIPLWVVVRVGPHGQIRIPIEESFRFSRRESQRAFMRYYRRLGGSLSWPELQRRGSVLMMRGQFSGSYPPGR